MKRHLSKSSSGLTMIELLIVVAIIAILAGLSFPAYSKMKEKAEFMKHVSNVKNFTLPTLSWAADHSQTLPSPQYPGGHQQNSPEIPEQWDFCGTGSGLWIDGVIFYAAMYNTSNSRSEDRGESTVDGISSNNGSHIQGTVFASNQSFKKDPSEEDWHKHSYAMNKSLQYDYLYANSSDPELTNKNLARILFRPNALLYIENEDSNVIGFENREDIIETGEKRWTSRKMIAAYLDGSVRSIAWNEIPDEDPTTDRESSRFWRGVDPE